MANLENIYVNRMNANRQAEIDEYNKYLKIRDERIKVHEKFLKEIAFLNKYGYKWEIKTYCNNGNDCCMAKYDWRVFISNPYINTSPFETIVCKEENGMVKGRWEPTILGHGRHVAGQDSEEWFTAEQLVRELARYA